MTHTTCSCGQRDCRCREPREANVVGLADEPYGVAPRALDAEVAEKVMGWRRFDHARWHRDAGFVWGDNPPLLIPGIDEPTSLRDIFRLVQTYPSYSTDIAAAWLVVEHLLKQKMYPDLISSEGPSGLTWRCCIDSFTDPESSDDPWPVVAADNSAPLAICRAALKAADARARATPPHTP